MTESPVAKSGFTLVNLVVIVVMVGLLAVVVVPWLAEPPKNPPQSKQTIAKIQITELETSLRMFAFDVGRYPTDSEGLQALASNPGDLEHWKGPYLRKSLALDPWGRPYVYRLPGTHGNAYDLYSTGPEGIEKPIGNWK